MTRAAQTPAAKADDALRALLRSQYEGVPAVILDSPPGAGKTGAVERLAAQALGRRGERVMIAAQTNAQAIDLARRLATGFPKLALQLLHRKELSLPEDLLALPNVAPVTREQELPEGPCVAVATAAKWVYAPAEVRPFDLLIVDEAYQLPEHRFLCIAGLARRIVLVGDPGQIDPVVTADVSRWRSRPDGPHVPSPRALLARHPEVTRLRLPVSRRLVAGTVAVVQPAFYADLPFEALCGPGERGLALRGAGDPALDRLAAGESLVWRGSPPGLPGVHDPELADTLVGLVAELFDRGAEVWDHEGRGPLRPEDVGVVCAQVAQVAAVRERLPAAWSRVLVETADRFQGLERRVMLVWHPLSGRADVSAFHLDSGRLCVMLSRHRIAAVVVGREGIDARLGRAVPQSDRALGVEGDPVYEGWRAHRTVLQGLGAG